METGHGTIRFDAGAVCAIAARLSESAEDSDDEIRRAFGRFEFDRSGAGSAHGSNGLAVENGYRRMRAACEAWVAATQRHADAVQVAADRYQQQDAATSVALSTAAEFEGRRAEQP